LKYVIYIEMILTKIQSNKAVSQNNNFAYHV